MQLVAMGTQDKARDDRTQLAQLCSSFSKKRGQQGSVRGYAHTLKVPRRPNIPTKEDRQCRRERSPKRRWKASRPEVSSGSASPYYLSGVPCRS